MTKLPDPLDQAAELSQQLGDAAVSNVRAQARPEQVRRADGTWPRTECADCDEPIEPARLEHGKVRCIACQRLLEAAQRGGYRG